MLDDLFFVFDEEGTALEWNQAVVDVTGYSDDVLATMTPADFFEGEDAGRVAAGVAEVLETGAATVEADLIMADGTRLPYEFSAQRVTDADDGAAFVGIGRNISQREGAERERRDILNRMSDAFFAVDSNWTITYANERANRLLSEAAGSDLSTECLEGSNLWDAVPEAIDTTFYEKYHEAMETQAPVSFEEYYEPLDRWFDVRVHPSEIGLSIFLYDITERKQQTQALEHRQRVLREMYDVISDRQLTFTEQVTALLELGRRELGVAYGTLSEIRGEDYIFEVVAADDESIQAGDVVPVSATNCEIAASTEQTLVLGDVERDAPEQTDRAGYQEWGISCYIGSPVLVDSGVYGTFCFYGTEPRKGQFSEWEVTLVDLMSRWVSYELQHQQANKRLEQQNEKLEQFASIVSHDLRSPLATLEGWLKLAEETGDPDQFARCQQAIDRMHTLIDDLLALARAGTNISETEPVDLESFVQRCWKTVVTTDASLTVETDRTVQADMSRLRQLFENLIRNAVEHGGESVMVTVGDLPDGFYVEDTGVGIPAENRDSVFESGYSTTDDGTGFGLPIVREIVDAHDWDIRVTEGREGGARFEITGVEFAEE